MYLKSLSALLVLSTALAVLNVAALEHSLYWSLPWFDVPMHFLGGVVVALAILIALSRIDVETDIVTVLLLTIVVGILWEIFELQLGFPREHNYAFDTTLDILMDALGGILGYALGGKLLKRS